ncbi:Zn-dependent protease (includes SpoIVFB) [Peptoclostridium litorale DSM 5388]|uniref:Peptidase M50 domain-containing protein n=1 Tax=Peptoclostridium litorale DSM 5388 TaxID=1121324 RepID=A0A069RIX6_PEPLI|nr:site-2 protease family protein [Peptoclostridium litorale]KDR94187.1 hypothetical protein CLIT_23c04600 [Peptoclostridium litorale DSM 5388]SIN82018.1 Zn-dependent protease (includes SpoIVFB) [Peptoclostridium litorale DSM 5388]
MLIEILKTVPAILLAISIHEFGHALAAYAMGDDTAKRHGRLTLDPIKHIDPIGIIMLLIFRFGWAKPVPVDENNFKNKRLGMIIVSAAGPVFNMICAVVFLTLYKVGRVTLDMYALNEILAYTVRFNIIFAAFNLIPIPPLDGSKIVLALLPRSVQSYYWEYEKFGMLLLLVLMYTGTVGHLIYPIAGVLQRILFSIA